MNPVALREALKLPKELPHSEKIYKRSVIRYLYSEYTKTKQLKTKVSFADYIVRRVNIKRKKLNLSEDIPLWDVIDKIAWWDVTEQGVLCH